MAGSFAPTDALRGLAWVVVRVLGLLASILFAIAAAQIFVGAHVNATSSPLPSLAYPVLVAAMIGWIWSLLRAK